MSDILRLQDIDKSYSMGEERVQVLKQVSLTVQAGEFISILGVSGSGKSTLMNIIGCMDTADRGSYSLDGEDVFRLDARQLAALRNRKIGFIFQRYHLLAQYDVLQNVMMPLLLRGLTHRQAEPIARESLARMGLEDRLKHRPSQLSGGQQQRVAIARTLAPEPSVLFMDEPLSNLDAKLRLEMHYELQRLHVETGSTFVYVTHDQMEAMTLATQICLIDNGVLQQYDAPLTVYHQPSNLFVADFVGNPSINFVEATGTQSTDGSIELTLFQGRKARFTPTAPLDLPGWFAQRDQEDARREELHKQRAADKSYVEKGNKDETFRYHISKVVEDDFSLQEEPVLTNEDLVLGIRPEFIDIAEAGALDGEIYGAMPTGMESTIKVRIDDFLLTGVVFGSTLFTIGSRIKVDISGDSIMLFDRKSGKCIALGSLSFS